MNRKAAPQDKDDEASVHSSVASLDKDLQALDEMDIDADFNMWSSFRGSFSVQKRASLEIIGKNKRSRMKNEKFDDLIDSINEVEVNEDPLHKLSPAEKKDIHQWNVRLGREQVFSRYYFPEQWELREMDAIQKFLKLENPSTSHSMLGDEATKSEQGEEATKRAVSSIFFPDDYDKKSVLLKRGPILLDGIDERELFLFSHGFLLSRIEFDSLMNLLLTMKSGNPEHFTSAQLKKRFNDIDSDHSGEIDRCELREIFLGMGVPIGENTLTEVMRNIDCDEDGTITFDEFELAMQQIAPTPPKEKRSLFGFLGQQLSHVFLSPSEMQRKLECACLFTDVEKIECLNMCHSATTRMFAQSSFGNLSFAIHVRGQEQPLVMICSKPEHKDAWINAFKICIVNSVQNATDTSAKEMRDKIGWQHQIVRATIFSLVVMNNLDGLHKQITSNLQKFCERDEYRGFTALHYAAALGRLDCAILLLQAKVEVNATCNEQKTPLDYAIMYEKQDMIKLLEQYGAQANRSRVLFESAIEEQKKLKKQNTKTVNRKTMAKAEGAKGAMSEAMSALKERGDRIEKLDKKTADLQHDAQNYAEMAKKLKKKAKKKTTFFGL